MRGLGFNALEMAAFFGLLAPLILFYFLKLRRPQIKIPSLALWQQVINDRRVNSPFQKFKRNLLLLLQIAALTLLVFSLMQPFFPSGAERARYLPIIVDCSASMGALDKPGGQTRLDEAKGIVARIIDNLLPDQKVCLIAMQQSARTTVDFTNNKLQLRKALADLKVEPTASKVEDALRIAQALSRTFPIEKVGLFTDGNIPAKIDFDLPFHLDYQKMSPAGANVGIAGINAVRRQSDWEVFVRAESSRPAP
ncbi:MAG: BatA and WFA domain-containing protein [Planctomycetales bacterium]